jgi:hypothetical protein
LTIGRVLARSCEGCAKLHLSMFLARRSQHPVGAAAYTVIMNVNMGRHDVLADQLYEC